MTKVLNDAELPHPPEPLQITSQVDELSVLQPPEDELSKSIAERKERRIIMRPKRFRDQLPEPVPAISVPEPQLSVSQHSKNTQEGHWTSEMPRNVFGLWWRYFRSDGCPLSNDPDDLLTLADLHDGPDVQTVTPPVQNTDATPNYYPFPNCNSFHLGSWYWDDNAQKSQKSFKALLDIIGDPDFSPNNVRNTKWDKINNILAGSEAFEEEWEDEIAGWKKGWHHDLHAFLQKIVSSRCQNLCYQRLLSSLNHSIIRERLSSDDLHFRNRPNSVRVYRELYTSPAFIKAHQKLCELPPEPGCDLPCYIVALMICSDATKLTTFGPAKLWPLYCFFILSTDAASHLAICAAMLHILKKSVSPYSILDTLLTLTIGSSSQTISRTFLLNLQVGMVQVVPFLLIASVNLYMLSGRFS